MKAKRFFSAVLLVAAGAGAAFVYLEYERLKAFRDTRFGSVEEKVVEVSPGTSPRAVVRLLSHTGALSDETLAWRYLRYLKRDPRPLRAGEYSFTGPLLPDEVLEKIYRGEVKLYRFTVPEGLRLDEIAAVVEKSGIAGAAELLTLARDARFAADMGVPAPNLEGYLFPETYAFAKGVRPRAILGAMVSHFKQEYRKAEEGRLPGIALTEPQAVTLASIIEKETGRPEERPRISCVFHNRLRLKMKLQTDPTVMYATMLRNGGRWSKNITRADLLAPHPYNTYTTAGLPPGPIASPGAAALAASLHPAECADLYFVSRNDGTHVFCPDLACHNAAVQKWQINFFRNGGQPVQAMEPAPVTPPAPAPTPAVHRSASGPRHAAVTPTRTHKRERHHRR